MCQIFGKELSMSLILCHHEKKHLAGDDNQRGVKHGDSERSRANLGQDGDHYVHQPNLPHPPSG